MMNTAPVPFNGFSSAGLQFLRDLNDHSNRDWFQAHKTVYESELKNVLGQLILRTTQLLQEAQVPLRADPKRSVFRIYRDVRFSADKRPYKTNVSAVFDRGLTKSTDGILYVHIEPTGSFAALAFYQPTPPKLTRLREAIVDRRTDFFRILDRLKSRDLEISPDEKALKRLPRGFEEYAETDIATFLKYRSFVIRYTLPEKIVQSDGLPKTLADFAAAGLPFLEFGWEALNG